MVEDGFADVFQITGINWKKIATPFLRKLRKTCNRTPFLWHSRAHRQVRKARVEVMHYDWRLTQGIDGHRL